MTKDQFDEFIANNDLFFSDGLIEITLSDGSVNTGVWISTLPSLDESIDGIFAGKPESEQFYLFGSDTYVVWLAEEIAGLKCLQQGYLKGVPHQLSQFKK